MAKKILIIEDDLDNLDLMSYILIDEGYEIITSLQIKTVYEIVYLQPDLILMDNRLGESNGGEVCLALKREPATSSIPVILVSAHLLIEELARQSKADGFIAKPYDLDTLVATVKSFLC